MPALLLLSFALLQASAPNARDVVRAIDEAVDRGRLDSVEAAWRGGQARNIQQRTQSLARAKIALYRYRFADAEKSLHDLRGSSLGDHVARYAAFELARVKLAQGYAAEASPLLLQVERAARLAGDSLLVFDAIIARAHALAVSVNPAAGLALVDSAPPIDGTNPRAAVARQFRRGRLLALTGDHRLSREVLHRAVGQANAIGLARTEARCRLALLASFVYAGQTDSVRAQFRAIEALVDRTGDLESGAVARQWVGTYAVSLGEAAWARDQLDSAVTLARLTRTDDVLAWAAYALTNLALEFRDAKDAASWLALSDSLMRARGDASGIAAVVALESQVAWQRGDYEASLRMADSSIAMTTRSGLAAHLVSAYEHHRWTALRLGRFGAAEQSLARRRDITSRHQLRGYEPALHRAEAEHALWNGEFARADSLFAAFSAALQPTQFALKHDVLLYRAQGKASTGDIANAERFARQAGNEYLRWRASITDPDDRKRAAQSSNAFGDAYGLPRLIAELVRRGRAETALELSEQRRALGLRDALALALPENRSQQSAGNDSVTDVRVDIRRLQLSIPDRQTAVVEYVLGVGDAPTTMLVATRDTVAGFDLGPVRTLAALVTRFSSLLEARRDARQLARDLGDRLIEPARAVLGRDVTRLVIVPDGALNLLPFDALLLRDGRFVLDAYETWLAPSFAIASSWWRQPSPMESSRPSLVFGDPAYQRTSLPAFRAAFRRPALELPRLPASGREAQSVARWLGNADLALGAQASEARLKKASGREMSVLHLASHAVVDDWSSERSFIALAPGDGEDGIVRAVDLAALGVRAKLVVLSACRTARGEVIGGEGVQSLGLPFLEQGTRAVIATSWTVADRHALTLTDRLYRSLSAGVPVGSALYQAKRTLKAAGASASEWGAYTLLGDGLLRFAARGAN